MTTPTLPPLPDDRVDAIETAVFGRIADERQRTRRRRRGIWAGIGAAAAVVVIAAFVGPSLTTRSSSGSMIVGADGRGLTEQYSAGTAPDAPLVPLAPAQDVAGSSSSSSEAASGDAAARDAATRDIVATGSSTVEVDDIAGAIDAIGAAATGAGGYVESSQLGGAIGAIPYEGGMFRDGSTTTAASSGWITVRVPAAALTSTMDGLRQVEEVTATTVSRSDVTEQTVDLRARVAAGEASVARLTELLAQAASVSDLITAESALADRQAQLDSDRQVLQSVESQVAMSSLSVQLVEHSPAVTADPAGFGDGLGAGWNGLVATLNGVVIGLGFLLPWIALAAVIVAAVWGIRRVLRQRRQAREG